MDDPLRILRVLRFAIRYQFVIDSGIEKAMMDEEVKKAFFSKISKERTAKEITLMFEGNLPHFPVKLLYRYNLLDIVLRIPENKQNINDFSDYFTLTYIFNEICGIVYTNLELIENIFNYKEFLEQIETTEFLKDFHFDILCFAFRNINTQVKKEVMSVSKYVLKISLMLPNHNSDEIQKIVENFNTFEKLVKSSNFEKLESGILIRKTGRAIIYKLIMIGIVNTLSVDIMKSNRNMVKQSELVEVMEIYGKWLSRCVEEEIINADIMKPILDVKLL